MHAERDWPFCSAQSPRQFVYLEPAIPLQVVRHSVQTDGDLLVRLMGVGVGVGVIAMIMVCWGMGRTRPVGLDCGVTVGVFVMTRVIWGISRTRAVGRGIGVWAGHEHELSCMALR
jgi:hypothetical protein